jgi:uncharacterized protein DUF397
MSDARDGIPGPGFVAGVRWVKSTHSGPTGGNCVEVASLSDGRVAVRNSRHPSGAALLFRREQWAEFVAAVRWAMGSRAQREPIVISLPG